MSDTWRGRIPAVQAEAEPRLAVIVAARNEADRIGATLDALASAFPGAALWVADDASSDGTPEVALRHRGRVVSRRRPHGKGANVTAACEAVLSEAGRGPAVVLLCDADLGESAALLVDLVDAVVEGSCDLAIAAFARRVGGGLGVAVGFAGWAIERLCARRMQTPISGQRAMRPDVLRAVLPFAAGFGMETGMTVDAVRGGYDVREIELDLTHRATGRTLGGFLHRGRQLRDIVRAYLARRGDSLPRQ
jgi:glycosyltransferase involved in cell wall biosynthesis